MEWLSAKFHFRIWLQNPSPLKKKQFHISSKKTLIFKLHRKLMHSLRFLIGSIKNINNIEWQYWTFEVMQHYIVSTKLHQCNNRGKFSITTMGVYIS